MLKAALAAALLCASVTLAYAETGKASYYWEHGSRMANGQRFDQWSDSCAHKSHRFGTRLRVTWRGRSVECVVRDRGPFIAGRIVDLSVAGARALRMEAAGVVPVTLEVIR